MSSWIVWFGYKPLNCIRVTLRKLGQPLAASVPSSNTILYIITAKLCTLQAWGASFLIPSILSV